MMSISLSLEVHAVGDVLSSERIGRGMASFGGGEMLSYVHVSSCPDAELGF